KDQSTSLAFQVQKRFSDGLEFSASYTYSHSLDVMSMTSDITSSNYNFAALDGTIENRNLRTSSFDRPNKVTTSGTVNAPFGARFSRSEERRVGKGCMWQRTRESVGR